MYESPNSVLYDSWRHYLFFYKQFSLIYHWKFLCSLIYHRYDYFKFNVCKQMQPISIQSYSFDFSRYTELPGTSYSPQRGPTQGFHLRQFSQGEPYNPLAPIREQPPMYKLTFEVTERSHDPGMPFRGPPPLPPRPNTVQRPSKQYYI